MAIVTPKRELKLRTTDRALSVVCEFHMVNGGLGHELQNNKKKYFVIKVSFLLGEAEIVNSPFGLFVQHFIMRNCNVISKLAY